MTSPIFGFELYDVVASVFALRTRLAHHSVTIYVGNNAELPALICGDSSAPIAASLIALLWHLVALNNISICSNEYLQR